MASILSLVRPLPPCLEASETGCAGRRHHVGSLVVSPDALDHFNAVLKQLGGCVTVDPDRLATAARALSDPSGGMPACIRERLRRARVAAAMAADRQWGLSDATVDTVRLLSHYIAASDDLIPDGLPAVGRLDDAIAVEAAWPRLKPELDGYINFHRMRRLLARTRDEWLRFDRDAWRRACGEAAAIRHQLARVRQQSYLPPAPVLFRVH